MGKPRLSRRRDALAKGSSRLDDQEKPDVEELLKENAQLRALVLKLIDVTMKSIVDRSARV
jgi:hypothetical protein